MEHDFRQVRQSIKDIVLGEIKQLNEYYELLDEEKSMKKLYKIWSKDRYEFSTYEEFLLNVPVSKNEEFKKWVDQYIKEQREKGNIRHIKCKEEMYEEWRKDNPNNYNTIEELENSGDRDTCMNFNKWYDSAYKQIPFYKKNGIDKEYEEPFEDFVMGESEYNSYQEDPYYDIALDLMCPSDSKYINIMIETAEDLFGDIREIDSWDISSEYMANKVIKYRISEYIDGIIKYMNSISDIRCKHETITLIHRYLNNIAGMAVDDSTLIEFITYFYTMSKFDKQEEMKRIIEDCEFVNTNYYNKPCDNNLNMAREVSNLIRNKIVNSNTFKCYDIDKLKEKYNIFRGIGI